MVSMPTAWRFATPALSSMKQVMMCSRKTSLGSLSPKVADLTTGNLEAYQHYFRGEQLKEAIRYEPAIEAYRRAIAVDPDFSLAHYRIAYLGKFTGLSEAEQRAEIDAALRSAHRVPAKERLLIQAWKAVMDGRSDEAHAMYIRAVEAHPDDKEVLFMAGDHLLHGEDAARALPYFERAVALDPTFEPALMHVVDSLSMLGRTKETLEASLRWTERAPSAAGFRSLTMAYLGEDRIDAAIAAGRRALALDDGGFSRANLAEALILAGRYGEAEALLRPFAAPAASRTDRLLSVPGLVAALAYQGRRAEALRAADAFPEDVAGKRGFRRVLRFEVLAGDGPTDAVLREARALSAEDLGHAKGLAVMLVWLGELATAERLAPKLAPTLRPHYDAAVLWRKGDLDGARELLRPAAATRDWDARAPALFLLATISAEAGADAEVISAAEQLRTAPSGGWRSWGLPRALYLAARAHERRGERREALAKVDEVLGAWRSADPDLPLLADLREARARLARPIRASSRAPAAP
jgi:tetratricopeptide (TPR) repeat protein